MFITSGVFEEADGETDATKGEASLGVVGPAKAPLGLKVDLVDKDEITLADRQFLLTLCAKVEHRDPRNETHVPICHLFGAPLKADAVVFHHGIRLGDRPSHSDAVWRLFPRLYFCCL